MKLDSFSNYGALRDPTRRWGSWYQPFLAFQMGSPSWWECLGPKCGRFGEVETKIPPIDWYRNSWKVPRCFPELVLSPKSPGLLAKNHLLLKRKLVTYPPLKTEKSSHPVTRFRHPPPKKGRVMEVFPSIPPFFNGGFCWLVSQGRVKNMFWRWFFGIFLFSRFLNREGFFQWFFFKMWTFRKTSLFQPRGKSVAFVHLKQRGWKCLPGDVDLFDDHPQDWWGGEDGAKIQWNGQRGEELSCWEMILENWGGASPTWGIIPVLLSG